MVNDSMARDVLVVDGSNTAGLQDVAGNLLVNNPRLRGSGIAVGGWSKGVTAELASELRQNVTVHHSDNAANARKTSA